MEFLLDFLPIIIYILLIIILIVGIILGIKMLITLDKVEKVVDSVNNKVETLNGFFHIIDYTTDKIAIASDKLVEGVTSFIKKLIFSKKKQKQTEEEDYE